MRHTSSPPCRFTIAMFTVSLCSWSTVAIAQSTELSFSSDRPGFANTSSVAAPYRLTTELGVAGSFTPKASTLSLPNTLLRMGVLPWLEVRLRGPSVANNFTSDGSEHGIVDPMLGFKVGGSPLKNLSVSLVSEISLPVGTEPFRSPQPNYSTDINIDWVIIAPITLTPNALIVSRSYIDENTNETARTLTGAASLKLSWQFHDVVGAYIQSYTWFDRDISSNVQVGGGLAWMASPRIQIDASFDTRVTPQGDAPSAGLGTTVLW